MGIFQKVGDILTANFNDLIERFEDPQTMLRQAIREMEAGITTTLDKAAKALGSQKIHETQRLQREREATVFRERAALAIQEENEPAARQWLIRAHECDRLAVALVLERDEAANIVERLRVRIAAMQTQLAEAKRCLRRLGIRRRGASLLAVGEDRSWDGGFNGAVARFSRWIEQAEYAQAEAEAAAELYGDRELSDCLEEQQRTSRAVEEELAELKKKLANQQ
ncbi:MAG: PspA/IM30 family protein [Planctomycetota bacterium]